METLSGDSDFRLYLQGVICGGFMWITYPDAQVFSEGCKSHFEPL